VQPFDQLTAVGQLCREAGVGYHLDGARLWNASVASGVSIGDYGRLFDTVSVCFSKGLGAPVGSVLVGSADNIARARVLRKRLGAGWRQAGMLAAAALHAFDHHVERLADDHAAARLFAEAVAAEVPGAVDLATVQTNIVVVNTGEQPAVEVAQTVATRGVSMSAVGPRLLRAVTHLDVTAEQCADAGAIVADVLAHSLARS
jgi:threonine aldolase